VTALLAKPVSWYEEMRTQAAADASATPLTNVAFVLDKSGSMQNGIGTTIEGFNEQVRVVREGAAGAGETTFTDVQFSTQVEVRRVASSLEKLVPLTEETYRPDGMTALHDALGDTIAALLQTRRIEAPRTATLVTVFTDGEENSSRRYSAEVLSELIKRLEATGRWTFALVGPHGGVTALAEMLSVKPANVAAYNPASVEERHVAFARTARASASYMSMRKAGVTQAAGLYADGDGDVPPPTDGGKAA